MLRDIDTAKRLRDIATTIVDTHTEEGMFLLALADALYPPLKSASVIVDTGVYRDKTYHAEKMVADFHRRWNLMNSIPASEEQATAYVTQYIGSLEREGFSPVE